MLLAVATNTTRSVARSLSRCLAYASGWCELTRRQTRAVDPVAPETRGELAATARCTPSTTTGSPNEQKKGNGLSSPYSSPMNNSGRHGESNSKPHASRCAAGESAGLSDHPAGGFPPDRGSGCRRRSACGPVAPDTAAVAAAMKRAVTTVVHEYVVECLGHLPGLAEIDVVAVALAGQQGVEGVVKIVAPDAVQAVAAATIADGPSRTSFGLLSAMT